MAFFNQSDWPVLFNPRKVNLKIPINGLQQAGIARPRKMTLGCWFHQILFETLQIDSSVTPDHGS